MSLLTFCLSANDDKQTTLFTYCVRLMMTMEGATIRTLLELLSTVSTKSLVASAMIEQMGDTPREFSSINSTHLQGDENEVAGRLVGMLSDEYFESMFTATETASTFTMSWQPERSFSSTPTLRCSSGAV